MRFKLKIVHFFAVISVFISALCNNVTAQTAPVKAKAKPNTGIEDDVARAKDDVFVISKLISNGTTTVDPTTGAISIKVDATKLDPKVLAKLKTQKSFKVDAPFEISKTITDTGFEKAKIAKPSKPLVVKAGTYPVRNAGTNPVGNAGLTILIVCSNGHCSIDIWW